MDTVLLATALLLSAGLLAFPIAHMYRSAPKTWLRLAARPSVNKPLRREQPLPPGVRGALTIKPESCIACGSCAYHCPSKALSLSHHEDFYILAMDHSKCILCGRCETACPTAALSHTHRPSARMDRSEHEISHRLAIKCRQCGREIEIPRLLSSHLYYHLTEERLRTLKLCAECKSSK